LRGETKRIKEKEEKIEEEKKKDGERVKLGRRKRR